MKLSKYSHKVKIIVFLTFLTLSVAGKQPATKNELMVDSTKIDNRQIKLNRIWQVDAGAHILKTTHKTHFKGANLGLSYLLSKSVSIGLGLEYSSLDFHNDNGWELRSLQFLPAYLEAKIIVKKFDNANIFLRPAVGVTLMKYTKVNEDHSDRPHTIHEKGLYLNLASGITFNVKKRIQPLIEIGFKGFNNSLNDLDVNPHGLTIRMGLLIKAF